MQRYKYIYLFVCSQPYLKCFACLDLHWILYTFKCVARHNAMHVKATNYPGVNLYPQFLKMVPKQFSEKSQTFPVPSVLQPCEIPIFHYLVDLWFLNHCSCYFHHLPTKVCPPGLRVGISDRWLQASFREIYFSASDSLRSKNNQQLFSRLIVLTGGGRVFKAFRDHRTQLRYHYLMAPQALCDFC